MLHHGSGRLFNRFDGAMIGGGRNAQAFSHGHYLAGNPLSAVDFRNAMESGAPAKGTPVRVARNFMDMFGGDRDRATEEALGHLADWHSSGVQDQVPGADRLLSGAIEHIQSGAEFPGGKMYQVNLKDDPTSFLDWNAPLNPSDPRSEAIDRLVVDAGRKRGIQLRSPVDSGATAGKMYRDLSDVMPDFNDYRSERAASHKLLSVGVPGMRFRDPAARSAGDINYSVFGDDGLNIVSRYARGGRISSFKVRR
jgi:hypothetical protein